mmetsp:Transcript_65492/g.128548  ORF Transcript_65492/g.128548 Transcript_65492/m.128548 type:complete len:229 (-) Transcript_65492:540-1226(-)
MERLRHGALTRLHLRHPRRAAPVKHRSVQRPRLELVLFNLLKRFLFGGLRLAVVGDGVARHVEGLGHGEGARRHGPRACTHHRVLAWQRPRFELPRELRFVDFLSARSSRGYRAGAGVGVERWGLGDRERAVLHVGVDTHVGEGAVVRHGPRHESNVLIVLVDVPGAPHRLAASKRDGRLGDGQRAGQGSSALLCYRTRVLCEIWHGASFETAADFLDVAAAVAEFGR